MAMKLVSVAKMQDNGETEKWKKNKTATQAETKNADEGPVDGELFVASG